LIKVFAPLLFYFVALFSLRKHGTSTINLMVSATCLARLFSRFHAQVSQTCNAKPYKIYGEAAFSCFLLVCKRPGHASILTIVLPIAQATVTLETRFAHHHHLLRSGDRCGNDGVNLHRQFALSTSALGTLMMTAEKC